MSETITLETKGLDTLLKMLKKSKPPVARVGVLGNSPSREKKQGSTEKRTLTNAEVGAVHEFGSPARNIPQRSFLRVPISENLEKYMENSGAFDNETMMKVFQESTIVPWIKKVAILAEAIVSDAFDSAGFGKWAAWKTPGYKNQANQILVDTQQLRNSITHEVKE